MKKIKTFEVKIYVGLQKGYSKESVSVKLAKEICQEYVNEIGWCITFTETEYIYKGSNEKGFIIGIIQYPRFPLSIAEIKYRTIELARKLLIGLNQNRLSIVFPDETIMLEELY